MENIFPALIDEGVAIPALIITAILVLGMSFLIVCCMRSMANKLLLLGVVLSMGSIIFAVTMPPIIKMAIILLVIAVILILAGVICGIISHFTAPRKAGS